MVSSLVDERGIDIQKIYQHRDSGQNNKMSKELEEKVAAVLDKRDLELGGEKYYFGASGREEVDDRDIGELEESELNEITDINTTEGALARLSAIAKKKNRKNIINQFKVKALPADNEVLADLGVRFTTKFSCTEKEHEDLVTMREYTEEKDEKIQSKLDKGNVSRKGISSSGCEIVTREAKNINSKIRKMQRKEKIARRNSTRSQSESGLSMKNNTNPRKRRRVTPNSTLIRSSMNGDEGLWLTTRRGKFACFDDDTCVLATIPSQSKNNSKKIQISIAGPLAKMSKAHQKEGIKFMWDKVLSDIIPDGDDKDGGTDQKGSTPVRGCILAHNMGLGKTLQTIALIHTLLTNPLLKEGNGKRAVSRILVIAPVNTLANWKNEIHKWIEENNLPQFLSYNLNNIDSESRRFHVEHWFDKGGVLYCSIETFQRTAKNKLFKKWLQSPGPDRKYSHCFCITNVSDFTLLLLLTQYLSCYP